METREKNPFYVYPVLMRSSVINTSKSFKFRKDSPEDQKKDWEKIMKRLARASVGIVVAGGGAQMLNPDFVQKGTALIQEAKRKTDVNRGYYFSENENEPSVLTEQINWAEFVKSSQYDLSQLPAENNKLIVAASKLYKVQEKSITPSPNPAWVFGYVVTDESPETVSQNFGIRQGAFFINKIDAEYFAKHKDVTGKVLARDYFVNLSNSVLSQVKYFYSSKQDISLFKEPYFGELALPYLMMKLNEYFDSHEKEGKPRMEIDYDEEDGIVTLAIKGKIPKDFFLENNIDPEATFLKKGDRFVTFNEETMSDLDKLENIVTWMEASSSLLQDLRSIQPEANPELKTPSASQSLIENRRPKPKKEFSLQGHFFQPQTRQDSEIEPAKSTEERKGEKKPGRNRQNQ